MLIGWQSSVSLQCCIDSQSLGVKGLYPATHLLHVSVVKDWENGVFPKKHLRCSISVHEGDLKGKVLENVFCDLQSTDLTPAESRVVGLKCLTIVHVSYFKPTTRGLIIVDEYRM